jgi:hypothetical protein
VPQDAHHGDGEGWRDVTPLHPGADADRRNRYASGTHLLRPAMLPALTSGDSRGGRAVRAGGRARRHRSPRPAP